MISDDDSLQIYVDALYEAGPPTLPRSKPSRLLKFQESACDVGEVGDVMCTCAERTFNSMNFSATDRLRSGYRRVIRYEPFGRW